MALAAKRHELILAAVRASGMIRLADLVERLGVTPVTIRRDVTLLADRGLVQRVHGGIALPHRAPVPQQTRATAPGPLGPMRTRAVVGMLVPSVEYYWPAVIQGAHTAVAATDGRLVMRSSGWDDPAEDRRQIDALLERGAQALLVAPATTGGPARELLRRLGTLARDLPVVLVERTPPKDLLTLPLDAATTAHALGAGLAVRHLVTLGHDRVALITTRQSPTSTALRTGWQETVAALGLPPHDGLDIEIPSYGAAGWADAYDKVLDHSRDQGIGALFVHSDREAIGLIERGWERGVTVPRDLAIVTYDDEIGAASDPPLTAVRPQKHRLGRLAAELALARLADVSGEWPVHRVELWPSVVVRESCGTPPTATAAA
ncbi:DNA-binding LacI/PurR family transcriptional regulator [Streptomyces sp. KhCrAH-43]|uniref:substrate-binding domain-containing protein n=1 Tax=Streptomyces TaxID=1883 RepID=UPI00037B063C|nr:MULTISPECIES: substrate-binding domain-containing protein [unclassified Streptomyces]MYS36610.1 substrate-binding domain-containing protein [Streptomyces sp. SID4920]MYX69081.1 substrate-binding domain-containing protein [Streptomyces sp. SID8373]RAJ61936.1 DNA-binding LacI/PurR family transcriptional regulator [Streptomyces sp. KhCrAH-43]